MKKLFLAACFSIPALLNSAPFDFTITATNSLGASQKVRMVGDEFQIAYETEDGYSLLKEDEKYFYAREGQSNSLESTRIELGMLTNAAVQLEKTKLHLRDRSKKNIDRIHSRIQQFEDATKLRNRWRSLKSSRTSRKKNVFLSPPSIPTVGCYTGLTILVDFPVENSQQTLWQTSHSNFTMQVCDDFLNGDYFSDQLNQSSVRKFFMNVSNGRLDYRNIVVGPVLMTYPREYYDDVTKESGECSQLFINELFDKIFIQENNPEYSQLLPKLRTLSAMDGYPEYVAAVNILYAGNHPTTWSKGLWPHAYSVNWRVYYYYQNADGSYMRLFNYQMTSVKNPYGEIYIGTFCHENGHLLCNFPDLYAYEGSSRGVGSFSLMGNGNYCYPPAPVDPYLSEFAGWITPINLPGNQEETTIYLPHDHQTVYKFYCPDNSNRYFLVENRQKSGLDAGLSGSGILIWRCDMDADNRYPTQVSIGGDTNQYAMTYELAVVQADGMYHLEKGIGYGSSSDYWYSRYSSQHYQNKFNDDTIPTAKWIDGKKSFLNLYDFSTNKYEMTCKFSASDNIPVFSYTGDPITPTVSTTWKNKSLLQDVDYVLVYSNNVDVGMAYVYVIGTNNFTGKILKKFKISDDQQQFMSIPTKLKAEFPSK